MLQRIIYTLFIFSICLSSQAQRISYTAKHFVSQNDTIEFKPIDPKGNGFMRTYSMMRQEVFDVAPDNTTYVKGMVTALMCIEGQYKNGKWDSVFKTYLLDSIDHSHRYRIWEQTYAHDKLNGESRIYSLKGNLVTTQMFTNDSLNGPSRQYWVDGKTIMWEREYFNGSRQYTLREYAKEGFVMRQTTFVNDTPNGAAKKFYPNGVTKDELTFVKGVPNGLRKYYYPSGKPWLVQEIKDGKPWTVISNLTEDGKKRDPGTLKGGNGTILLYNDDGTVRETTTYKDGIQVKK